MSYGWDDNGNLTSRGSDDFDWDAEDRLTSATVSSVTTAFTYNGDGLRDSLTTGGNTTTFTWDVNRGIPQVLDDEDLRYVYGIGRIAQVGASTHYYLSDGLGSTMALTDADGDLVNDYDYDVFGALRDSSGSQDNDFTFAGEQVDGSTGLQYLRARYYDVATGRFMSRDPFPGSKWWPKSLNRYVYAGNSPTLVTDPSGFGGTPGCGAMTSGLALDRGGLISGARPGSGCIGGGVAGGGGSAIAAILGLLLGEQGKRLAEQIIALLDSEEPGGYEGQDSTFPPISIPQSDREHVVSRHGPGGSQDSQFGEGVDIEGLVGGVDGREPIAADTQISSGNIRRVFQEGSTVGVDLNGQPTTEWTLVVRPDGSLVTAHPGRPSTLD